MSMALLLVPKASCVGGGGSEQLSSSRDDEFSQRTAMRGRARGMPSNLVPRGGPCLMLFCMFYFRYAAAGASSAFFSPALLIGMDLTCCCYVQD